MKKIIFRSVIFIFFVLISLISYLYLFGIETNRLNDQISKKIKDIDNNLDIELNQVKLVLDPFKFKIIAKTVGPVLKSNQKTIEFESIKTQVLLSSIIYNNFALSSLEISTKSLEIKKMISFLRSINSNPKLYILEKLIKKGYLIADISIEFDEDGKIKNNYLINGFIKDAKLDIFKKYELDKLNLTFNVKDEKIDFDKIELLLNNLKINSKKISVDKANEEFIVSGEISGNDFKFKKEEIEIFLIPYFPNLDVSSIDFNIKNKFFFKINNKFHFKDLSFNSELKINEMKLENFSKLKKIFPDLKDQIIFSNHNLKIDYNKKNFSIDGSGNLFLDKKPDRLKYSIVKDKMKYNFDTYFNFKNTSLKIDFLNYLKKKDLKSEITVKGSYIPNKKVKFEKLVFKENKNVIEIEDLILNNKFAIIDLKKIRLNYLDKEKEKNFFNISKKKERYSLNGKIVNINHLIDKLLNDEEKQNLKIFSKSFKVNLKIDVVSLDKENKLNNLKGELYFKKNNIQDANLSGSFSNNEKFLLTIKSNNNEKITNLFLDKAEPLVKRYKFIKGYENGSLDFFSSKKGNQSISSLRIYNFKIKELPILTKILTLASLQGIADLLSGEGIRFDEFEMNFKSNKNTLEIEEVYAIGPAISILMNGYVEKNKLISLRGTLVPATTLNKVIGNIPFLGKILVGSKTGEGVFGVSFKIKGPPKNLETTVNPIKTLTPRFITRTLEQIKKN